MLPLSAWVYILKVTDLLQWPRISEILAISAPLRDRDTGKGVAQLVGMQMLDAVELRKLPEVTLRAMRVPEVPSMA